MSNLTRFCLPEKGLLRDYLDYAEPLTDAPMVYHLFVGLTVLAVTLGNRVYLPFGTQRLYPNLYTVLLGPTSFYRKSSAIAIGRSLLDNFDEHLILPDEFSRERLYEKLAQTPQGLLIWSEFGAALENFNRDYMLGTKEFFADLFDCRPKYRRELRESQFEILNPCISILSASTPEWLRSRIREADVLGGFFPRFLYIAPIAKTKFLALPPSPNKGLEARIVKELCQLKDLSGEVRLDEATQNTYQEWAEEWEARAITQEDGPFLAGFYARLCIYTLKFGMLYHLAEGRSLTISSQAMSRALALTEYLKRSLGRLFERDLAFTREGQDKARVLNLVERKPGITRSKLLRASKLSAKRLREAIETLRGEESIQLETEQLPNGKTVTRYLPLQDGEG